LKLNKTSNNKQTTEKGLVVDPKADDFNGTSGLALSAMELLEGKSLSHSGSDVVIAYLKSTETPKSFPPISEGHSPHSLSSSIQQQQQQQDSHPDEVSKKYLDSNKSTRPATTSHMMGFKKASQTNLFNRLKVSEYGAKVVKIKSRNHSMNSATDMGSSSVGTMDQETGGQRRLSGADCFDDSSMSIADYMEQQHRLMKEKKSKTTTTQLKSNIFENNGDFNGKRLVDEVNKSLEHLSMSYGTDSGGGGGYHGTDQHGADLVTMTFEVKEKIDDVSTALDANSQFAARTVNVHIYIYNRSQSINHYNV
jgi:hypothetical protein